MKKIISMVLSLMMATASIAFAQVKDSGVVPRLEPENMVQLNVSPDKITRLVVYIYDDAAQHPPLELSMAARFTLLPGQGFNYLFTDNSGTYWQLVDKDSAVGLGLSVNCEDVGGCKYFRAIKR